MGKQVNAAFTLALKQAADIEGFPCEEIYTIRQDGVPLLNVYFGWSVDSITGQEFAQSARVESVAKDSSGAQYCAENLPFVYSPFQLFGLVQECISENQTAEHEFTSCVFFTEEGEEIELPLIFTKD